MAEGGTRRIGGKALPTQWREKPGREMINSKKLEAAQRKKK